MTSAVLDFVTLATVMVIAGVRAADQDNWNSSGKMRLAPKVTGPEPGKDGPGVPGAHVFRAGSGVSRVRGFRRAPESYGGSGVLRGAGSSARTAEKTGQELAGTQ